jgi:serine/threonine protein kinase
MSGADLRSEQCDLAGEEGAEKPVLFLQDRARAGDVIVRTALATGWRDAPSMTVPVVTALPVAAAMDVCKANEPSIAKKIRRRLVIFGCMHHLCWMQGWASQCARQTSSKAMIRRCGKGFCKKPKRRRESNTRTGSRLENSRFCISSKVRRTTPRPPSAGSCTLFVIARKMECVTRKIEGRIGDKYQLSAILGQGATGTVYAAKNLRTQRRVAIKSLHLVPGLNPGSPELLRFEQEARITGSLESPHLVQILDVEHDPTTDLPFLVMEMLRGEDLQALLDRVGPLQVDVALRIAAQACAGLAAAHAANVIHRDIKPANIFLSRQEKGKIVVKILDFGVAKIRRLPNASENSQALAAPTVSMTDTGQIMGSPLFMSPEQVDGAKPLDARSDLFSLGTTLFAMLAGKAPHAEIKEFYLLLRRLMNGPPPPIRTVANWVPPQVETFLQKTCALDRDDRFSSAKEMLVDLEGLLPHGSDLREDMLIGIGDGSQVVVNAVADSNPYAQTEQVTIEPQTGEAALVSSDPTPPTAVPMVVAESNAATLQSATLQSATLQSAAPPVNLPARPPAEVALKMNSNAPPTRTGLVLAIVLVVVVVGVGLFWFTR